MGKLKASPIFQEDKLLSTCKECKEEASNKACTIKPVWDTCLLNPAWLLALGLRQKNANSKEIEHAKNFQFEVTQVVRSFDSVALFRI